MDAFQWFTDNLDIIHEDVFMRSFFQSLHRDVGFWFRGLKADSIYSWNTSHDVFLRYWGVNKSYDQFRSELYGLKRENNEGTLCMMYS